MPQVLDAAEELAEIDVDVEGKLFKIGTGIT
jgi:hypothetical protein